MAPTEAIGDYPVYFKQPIRWLRYHAHTRPHIFYSIAIGLLGPLFVFVGTPIRRTFMYDDHIPLPLNGYPLPNRPRDTNLKGFED